MTAAYNGNLEMPTLHADTFFRALLVDTGSHDSDGQLQPHACMDEFTMLVQMLHVHPIYTPATCKYTDVDCVSPVDRTSESGSSKELSMLFKTKSWWAVACTVHVKLYM